MRPTVVEQLSPTVSYMEMPQCYINVILGHTAPDALTASAKLNGAVHCGILDKRVSPNLGEQRIHVSIFPCKEQAMAYADSMKKP